jgi:hypothetical protein
MTYCICENHKDELKALSLRQLGLKIRANINLLDSMYKTWKTTKAPDDLKKDYIKNWPLELEHEIFENLKKFIEDQICKQRKIIDFLIEELENRE